MGVDEALAALKDALQQYLALGDTTPVADQAAQLLDAVNTQHPSPEAGTSQDPSNNDGTGQLGGARQGTGQDPAADATDMDSMDYSSSPTPKAKTFADANKGALPELMRRNKKK